MGWDEILKKKKGTPFPKYIQYPMWPANQRKLYGFISQKKGKGKYGQLKRLSLTGKLTFIQPPVTIKIFKEEAIKYVSG